MRWILMIAMMMSLTGCLTFEGIATTGASTAGAVVGTVLGGPTVGAVVGAGAGLATDAAIPEPTIAVEEITSFWQLLAYATQQFFSHIVAIGIVGVLIWFLTGYIGLRMKRPEERKIESILMEKLKK